MADNAVMFQWRRFQLSCLKIILQSLISSSSKVRHIMGKYEKYKTAITSTNSWNALNSHTKTAYLQTTEPGNNVSAVKTQLH